MKTYVKYSLIAWLVFTLLVGWFIYEISDHMTSLLRVFSFVAPGVTLFYLNLLWLSPKLLEKERWRLYIAILLVLAFAHMGIFAPFDIYMDQTYPLDIPHFSERPAFTIYFGRLFSSIPPIVISALLWKSLQLQKEREESLELKHRISEAEARALKAQINPHFLFNSLNNIYSLTQIKSDRSGDAILQLSEILRFVTYEGDRDRVKLDDELKQIDNFIQLQFLKDDNHENVSYSINDGGSNLMIAPMLLLPFVENSFKHSNFEDKQKGWIDIDIHVEGHSLVMNLKNSASLRIVRKDKTGGVGMENVKKRLSLIYPDKHKLDIKQTQDSYNVKLELDLSV